ncbi:MAG: glycosyltransferase family 2 protein [Streptococcaceae bacterium]|jgi:glycosyltransferase involved in cell wall biosynthesis|nr:glycosyltransferase family 2 protein [Streptococcaceae bacterium]
MQKLLTIAVPCYNSQNYMKNCIHSLLAGDEEVEILIIDDGSTDDTAAIADDFAKRYPTIIRAIHQENGGHGAAVNTGIREATGLYFKVVDSDDWLDAFSYDRVLTTLRHITKRQAPLDMMITNFIYHNEAFKNKKGMNYRGMLPTNRLFSWDEVRHFYKGNYMLMHALIYRTELLRDCGLKLPEHTFYVDNIYAYVPLPHVKVMYYLDVDFYRYFIGRPDQSVNESNMIARIDQQLLINRVMIDAVDIWNLPSKKLRNYLLNYLEIITTVSSVVGLLSGTPENIAKKDALWEEIKARDLKLYRALRGGLMGRTMNLPGKAGQRVSVAAYHLTKRLIGFN